MTQDEILENNELIAKFMGAEFIHDDPKDHPDGYYMLEGEYFMVEDFGFHESWDWLMPVVEKIENLTDEENNYLFSFDCGRDFCVVNFNDLTRKSIVCKSVYKDKMGSIWKAVVEFIKWYNNERCAKII